MGNQREFIPTGGFSASLYEDNPGWEPRTVNGVQAKVIKLITDKTGKHSGLPSYADTSDMYLRVGHDGDVIQAKLYKDRKHCLDFDWGHVHKNKGEKNVFPKGVVHVQTYSVSNIGVRYSNNARLMTEAEIKKYGAILKAFNPKVKFRP